MFHSRKLDNRINRIHESSLRIVYAVYNNYESSFDELRLNPLTANPTKRSSTLKQFVGKLQANDLSEFDHFVGLALKRLKITLLKFIIGNYKN